MKRVVVALLMVISFAVSILGCGGSGTKPQSETVIPTVPTPGTESPSK